MGNILRITRRCTLISLSAIVSQNRLNPIMQRAKIDRSMRRALPVYDNDFRSSKHMLTHLLRGGNSKLLYDNVEQEKPEFTYFDAFIPFAA